MMNAAEMLKINELAASFRAQGAECIVGRKGVHMSRVAELVRFAVLLERAGINVLDMGRPTMGHGTLVSVMAGGGAGTVYTLPFECD